MEKVTVHALAERTSEIMEGVRGGTEYIITVNGEDVARITPPVSPKKYVTPAQLMEFLSESRGDTTLWMEEVTENRKRETRDPWDEKA